MLTLHKRAVWPLFFLFCILLIANIWYFFSREWESSFYPVSYAELYYPSDVPTIKKWEQKSLLSLQVDINWYRNVDTWRILTDGVDPQTGTGMKPVFSLLDDEGKFHSYTLNPLPEGIGPSIELSIRCYSKEFYEQRGMKHNDVYTIKTNVPVGSFTQYPVSYWVDDYAYVGKEGLAETRRLIKEEAGIDPADPVFTKMEKLTRYLRKKLVNARGVPKDDFRWMNPWLIYNEMAAGTGKGWCTQHAQIYVFFANMAGIPTRLIQGARTQDNHFVYSGHTWAESYIPEQQRWAFVDLSHSHIYITDKNGKVLNSAELFHLNQHDAFDGVSARIYKDWEWNTLPGDTGPDSLATVPFALCNRVVKNEFTHLAIIKIRRPPNVEGVRTIYSDFFKDRTYFFANIELYLFKPPLAYSFYPTEGKRTCIIRRILFFSLITVLLLLIITAIFSRKNPGEIRKP